MREQVRWYNQFKGKGDNRILPQETINISNKQPKLTPKAIRERTKKPQT